MEALVDISVRIWFIIFAVQGLVCGCFAACVADNKGWEGAPWFCAGFFFGIIGLIAAAGLPLRSEVYIEHDWRIKGAEYECPYCRKRIDKRATVCPYCSTKLEEQEAKLKEQEAKKKAKKLQEEEAKEWRRKIKGVKL